MNYQYILENRKKYRILVTKVTEQIKEALKVDDKKTLHYLIVTRPDGFLMEVKRKLSPSEVIQLMDLSLEIAKDQKLENTNRLIDSVLDEE